MRQAGIENMGEFSASDINRVLKNIPFAAHHVDFLMGA
jgi:hypothetical protein